VLSVIADAAWWLAALTLAVGATVVALNAFTFRRLVAGAPAAPPALASVSVLVPARDEAATLPETLPPLVAQGAGEVLVLDDDSSDGTAAVVMAIARRHPQVRLLRGEGLPPGWSGKNWACHQLASQARGSFLLFTDADVVWRPGALAALLEAQQHERADLTTAWPRQRCVTLGERVVVPLVDMLLLTSLPAALARLPIPRSLTGANGQCMLWRRDAYLAVGGHAGVRGDVLEDVRLAQATKGLGRRVALRLGGGVLEVRMYRGYRDVVQGFAKNVRAAVGGSGALLLAVLAVHTVAYLVPWPMAFFEGRWWPLAIGGVLLRGATNALAGRSPLEAPLQPFAPLALAPIVALALRWGRGYEWRGRRYG
jgi:glycosyltransferase involved in cell wall biosynthesis